MSAPGGRGDRLPILCLDFDGVIHDYRHGWKDGGIYGDVTPGFFEWAEDAAKRFTLVVYSSRSKTAQGRADMVEWLLEQANKNGFPQLPGLFTFSADKPPAYVTIDDRCIRFDGDWTDPDLNPAVLRSFKPWMSRATP
jgi:hypothetical protein